MILLRLTHRRDLSHAGQLADPVAHGLRVGAHADAHPVVEGVCQRIFLEFRSQFGHFRAAFVSQVSGLELGPSLVTADIVQGDGLAVREFAYFGNFLTDTVNFFLRQIRVHKDGKLFFLINIVGKRGGAHRENTENGGSGSGETAVTAGTDETAAGGASAGEHEPVVAELFLGNRTAFCQRLCHLGRHGEGLFDLHHIFFIHNFLHSEAFYAEFADRHTPRNASRILKFSEGILLSASAIKAFVTLLHKLQIEKAAHQSDFSILDLLVLYCVVVSGLDF